MKEYACLTCNYAVRADCATLGKHNGHSFGDFKEGFEKVANEFEAEMEVRMKESRELMKDVSEELEKGIKASQKTLEEIKINCEKLIKKICEKEKEMCKAIEEFITNQVDKLKETKTSQSQIENKFKECKYIIEKRNNANLDLYEQLLKKVSELKKVKESYEKFINTNGIILGKFEVPNFSNIENKIDQMVLNFVGGVGRIPEKQSMKIAENHKMLEKMPEKQSMKIAEYPSEKIPEKKLTKFAEYPKMPEKIPEKQPMKYSSKP